MRGISTKRLLSWILTPGLRSRFTSGGTGQRLLSSASSGQGEIREATPEDYDQVMEISHDVHGGRDYLPCLFHSFVENKDVHCYVYELDGEVVAFEAAHTIDAGMTLVTRGARVRQDCQGKGIGKTLRKFIVDKLANDHTLKSISMTTTNTSGLATKPSVLATNKEIFRRDVHVFPYVANKLELPENDDFVTHPITQLNAQQLCSMFEQPQLNAYFFPRGRIIINTVPFRLMKENVEPIQMENPHIFLSDKLIQSKKAPRHGIMSLTTWFSCKAGICVDLEFYGNSSNFPEVCNHVGGHLRHVSHLGKHGHLMVPHTTSIKTDVLMCVMSRFGLSPVDSPYKTQHLFEQSLDAEDTSVKSH